MFKSTRAGVLTALLAVPVVAACQAQAQVPATIAPTAVSAATAVPTPAATATPVATPAPTAPARSAPVPSDLTGLLYPSAVGRTLAPGRHDVGAAFAEPLSFEVPAGFALDALREGNVAVSSPHGWLGAFAVEAVFPDPCRITGDPVVVEGGAALLDAMRRMAGFTAGDVTASSIDGRRVRSFELSNDIDTASAGCTRAQLLPLFTSLGNPDGESTNGGTHQVVWVIDGKPKEHLAPEWEGPVLVVADSFASDADLDVLERIVASIDFE